MAVHSIDVFRTDLDGTDDNELSSAQVDEVTWTLNKPGSAKIGFDPLSADASLIELSECELQIWFNESLADGHCVVPRAVGGNTDRIVFDGEGILSYFEYAYVAVSDPSGLIPPNTPILHWTGQEQFNIALELIDWVQSQPNNDRRIDSGLVSPSGIFRTRTFYRDSMENVWDALEEFPKLHEGFDFDIVLFDDGRREFWPYYPNKGSYKPQYGLSFDTRGRKWVEGIEDWKESTVNQATDVWNTGGTITDETPDPDVQYKTLGRYENSTPEGSPKYGRLQKVISSGQIIDLGWLADRAREEQLLVGKPIVTAKLAVSSDLFGLIKTGDVLPVNLDYGRLRMRGDWRIMEITWRTSAQNMAVSFQPATA